MLEKELGKGLSRESEQYMMTSFQFTFYITCLTRYLNEKNGVDEEDAGYKEESEVNKVNTGYLSKEDIIKKRNEDMRDRVLKLKRKKEEG